MEEKIKQAINFFKKEIFKINKPIEIRAIGSNLKGIEEGSLYNFEKDFDIIIVVSDETDCYKYVNELSRILKGIIIKYGIEIDAYPINESIYNYGKSEFLKNVKEKGVEL